MKTHASFYSLTLASAFEQFLEASSFARRTRESYADDLAPLLAEVGQKPATALTDVDLQAFLTHQESLAPATYNRRLAALRSFTRWLREQGRLTEALLDGVERKPEGKRAARALDAQKVESVLRKIEDPRDRALFWLIYDGGLRSQEALSIDIEDISWSDRSIRLPRRADLDADGYARLSYRQADTLWKGYTPDWDLHQLRHTAISLRAAHDYTEVDLKRFSGHSSLRSLERYIADNREAAKRKAREWERRERFQ